MNCPKCGKSPAFSMIPYQRIHRDKETGHWIPSSWICQCDPDDYALFGLIKYKEAKDEERKKKEGV